MSTSTADLWDERGDQLSALPTQFRDLGGRVRFSGPARTVRCLEDNVVLAGVLETPGDGAVLVVDGAGSLACALMGDRIAGLAVAHGWSGVIINGAVRDSVALADLPLGIKALGTNPRKSGKAGSGAADVEVTIGGVVIRPGAMITADEDGVVVAH
ncbi:ribonuclease E activity regulator RraA [Microbacterium kribbense]|uniref:4-hydroxy-4-methyl-2-oxoglutarate aldolase n=1 Tax=Microbacterium kribbense TaxID=433645 RepID=A0ABP7GCQ1_9MICO